MSLKEEKKHYLNKEEKKKLSKAKYKLLKYQQRLDSYHSREYRTYLNTFINLSEKECIKKIEHKYKIVFSFIIIVNILLYIIII